MTNIKQMCYNSPEVIAMDENLEKLDAVEETPAEEIPEETPAEETPAYVPRPVWQVWLARVALVAFIAMILLYYINMMRG
ncbi:MAG: hypothetical protein IKA47_09185 [Oscillospiraceae bacterium]|nr:hypothetical protein [Oscillospiraceae bacterium]